MLKSPGNGNAAPYDESPVTTPLDATPWHDCNEGAAAAQEKSTFIRYGA
jgi:hypothetical protein